MYGKHTLTSTAGGFSGCQKSPFCPHLMQEGNRQLQKGGSLLTLSFLATQKRIFMRCLCLQAIHSVPEASGAVCHWDGAAPLVAGGLVEKDAARLDLLWAGHLRAA